MKLNEDQIIKTIYKSIKKYRKETKISQEELAKKIGVTHPAISYWENGVSIPNVRDIWLIADALGVSIDELVGREL